MARTDSRLPLDANGHPIQVMPIKHSHVLEPSDAAADRNSSAIEAEIVTLIGNAAFYWAQGDDGVTATDSDGWWPANVALDIELGADTHVSMLRQDGTGDMIARVYERS